MQVIKMNAVAKEKFESPLFTGPEVSRQVPVAGQQKIQRQHCQLTNTYLLFVEGREPCFTRH